MRSIFSAIGRLFERKKPKLTGGLGQPFWHIHHEALLEFATEPIENRIAYIREDKPAHEIETRLRLLAPVKGKLPDAVVDAWRAYDDASCALGNAWRAYDDAGRARDNAWRAYDDASCALGNAWRAYDDARRALDNAWRALDNARRALGNAWRAHNDARRAYYDALDANRAEIEALHAQECYDCPWDGYTIFPEV